MVVDKTRKHNELMVWVLYTILALSVRNAQCQSGGFYAKLWKMEDAVNKRDAGTRYTGAIGSAAGLAPSGQVLAQYGSRHLSLL